MAERTSARDSTSVSGRRPSVLGIVFALAFLAVAGGAFRGYQWWFGLSGGAWVATIGIAVVGLLLLVSAAPRRTRSRQRAADQTRSAS